MAIEIKVPVLPESVTDATVAKWYKNVGDQIKRDENLVDLETDKVMLEVPAPKSGVIEKIISEEGSVVKSNEILALIREGEPAAEVEKPKPVAAQTMPESKEPAITAETELRPSVRRLIAEHQIDIKDLAGTTKEGRITKEDVLNYIQQQKPKAQPQPLATAEPVVPIAGGVREEKRVPMSRLRARIAERLVEVQRDSALLTTFNEINMKPAMDLRKQYKERFEKIHGVRLGFMSFFTKATIEALKRFPAVNASIDGNDVIYHNFYDIGIAIGSPRGLVVPIIRNAETLSMADTEKSIKDFAEKAKTGKLNIEDMMGGTFTITNGGVYGSMMSTPIINPPQTAILGMHKIMERPVVEKGEIVIRPMMYVALSYDHRLIDGSESVQFLIAIKELIEDPARLLLEV